MAGDILLWEEKLPVDAPVKEAQATPDPVEQERVIREPEGLYPPAANQYRAPNGEPSRLLETLGEDLGRRAWYAVRTPAFKEWFGDWESIAEIAAMETRIAEWTSKDAIDNAKGKSRAEIFKEYDNTLQPIAYVPERYLSNFSGIAPDNRVYCGQAYFLDHVVNHHPEITIAEYGNLQEILNNPDEIIIDRRINNLTGKPRDNLLFTKKYSINLITAISLEEGKDGKIILHKSLYGHKKTPYPSLPRVQGVSSGGGLSPIDTAASAASGGSLSARDDTLNIGHFVRSVNPSEVSQVRDPNGEPLPELRGGVFVFVNSNTGQIKSVTDNAL